MTNRELLTARREQLSTIDRQRLFVLRVEMISMPCPACNASVNALKAAGVEIDRYDFGRTKPAYCCPACGAELEQATPPLGFGPVWFWKLKPDWLRARLAESRVRRDTPAGHEETSAERPG